MRYAGYIGTALAFSLSFVLQQYMPDEFVRFLMWTVPSTIAIVSWFIELIIRSKKMHKWLVTSITENVMDRIEKKFDEQKEAIRKEVVDEVWERIDTITKIRELGEGHDEDPAATPKS